MDFAPRTFYTSNFEFNSTLSALRQYISLHPDAIYLDLNELANCLGHLPVEVAAALEALRVEGEVLP